MKHTCTTIQCVSAKEDLISLNSQLCSDHKKHGDDDGYASTYFLRARVATTPSQTSFLARRLLAKRLVLAFGKWCACPHGKQLHQEKTPPWARARPGSCFRFTQIRLQLKMGKASTQRNVRAAGLGPASPINSSGLAAPPEETHKCFPSSTFPELGAGDCWSWSGQR